MARWAKSTPVACQPWFARVITLVPVPHPRSRARLGGWREIKSINSGGEMPVSQGGFQLYHRLKVKRRQVFMVPGIGAPVEGRGGLRRAIVLPLPRQRK